MITRIFSIFALAIAFLLAGCTDEDAAKRNVTKAAQAAAESLNFTDNAEVDNIKNRLKLTSQPGLLGFVVLLNESGQPVYYASVKGKITSGSKRLTRTQWLDEFGTTNAITPAPSDEGTYGSSGEYIFFWTTNGQYMQWNGKYLYSDKPIRLTVQPLVVSVDEPTK